MIDFTFRGVWYTESLGGVRGMVGVAILFVYLSARFFFFKNYFR